MNDKKRKEKKKKLTSASVSGGNLGQISEVVALHFEVKNLTFCVASLWNEVLVQKTLKQKNHKKLYQLRNCVYMQILYREVF